MSDTENISKEEVMAVNPLLQCKERIQSDMTKTRIAIVTHRNPDPDSIASAVGLSKLLKAWNPDVHTTYLYSGDISHAQNKTLVNVFSINMTPIDEVEDLQGHFDYFIVVDSVPERALPDDIPCLLAIDHHRSETKMAELSDIRPVGATASIVCDYFRQENIELQETDENDVSVATLLIVGIYTDTNSLLSENVTATDVDAYQKLIHFVDRRQLQAVMDYPIPAYYFELRSKLDRPENVRIDNGVFVGGIGYMAPAKRDAIPMMADERARVEDINTAFVFGVVGDSIEVSVRSSSLSVDVNSICQKIFGKQYAGGKMGAGAAKVPLGFMVADANAPEVVKDKLWDAVKELLIDKIFHVMSGNA